MKNPRLTEGMNHSQDQMLNAAKHINKLIENQLQPNNNQIDCDFHLEEARYGVEQASNTIEKITNEGVLKKEDREYQTTINKGHK